MAEFELSTTESVVADGAALAGTARIPVCLDPAGTPSAAALTVEQLRALVADKAGLDVVLDTETETDDTYGGSIVYEKWVDFGGLPNATTKTVAHGIADLGQVIGLTGVATDDSSGYRFPLPHATGNENYNIQLEIRDDDIFVNTVSTSRTSYNAFVRIVYIKESE